MPWQKLITSASNVSQLVNDAGYVTDIENSFDIESFPDGTGITVVATDKLVLSDAGTEKYIQVDQLANGMGLDTMASQSRDNVNIDGGDIASGVTINKSPVVNFNSGDVQGSLTLTNLASGNGSLTIQTDAVEHSMLNANTINGATSYGSNLTANDEFLIYEDTATDLRKITYSTLSASLANTGFIGIDAAGTGDVSGPGSSTDNAIARWNGTGGDTLQNSSVIIDDSDNVTGVNNLTIDGDLIVNGTTTYVNTDNLLVEDKFILLASGSFGVPGDGGIIVEGGTENTGHALYWDNGETRWAFDTDLSGGATSGTADAFVGVIEESGVDPSSNPAYGGATGNGTIHVNTADSSIWVFTQ